MDEYEELFKKLEINRNLITDVHFNFNTNILNNIDPNLKLNEPQKEPEIDLDSLYSNHTVTNNEILELKKNLLASNKNKIAYRELTEDNFYQIYLDKEIYIDENNNKTYLKKKRKIPFENNNKTIKKLEIILLKYKKLKREYKEKLIDILNKCKIQEVFSKYQKMETIDLTGNNNSRSNDNLILNCKEYILPYSNIPAKDKYIHQITIETKIPFEVTNKDEKLLYTIISNKNDPKKIKYTTIISFNIYNEKVYKDPDFKQVFPTIIEKYKILLPVTKKEILIYLEQIKEDYTNKENYNPLDIYLLIEKVLLDYSKYEKQHPEEKDRPYHKIDQVLYKMQVDPYKLSLYQDNILLEGQKEANKIKINIMTDEDLREMRNNDKRYITLGGYNNNLKNNNNKKSKKLISKNNMPIDNYINRGSQSVIKSRSKPNDIEKLNKYVSKSYKRKSIIITDEIDKINNLKQYEDRRPKYDDVKNDYKNLNWEYNKNLIKTIIL